jgi:hypothetical protein
MHVDYHGCRSASLRELFDTDGKGKGVKPRAAVLAWDQDSEQARLRSSPDGLLREAMLAVNFSREREDRALGELAHRCTKCGVGRGEIEIQLRR